LLSLALPIGSSVFFTSHVAPPGFSRFNAASDKRKEEVMDFKGFVFVLSLTLLVYNHAIAEPVICGYPNGGIQNSTHLVPFMKMEAEEDHVKVTVLERGGQPEISENLYFYFIPSDHVNERSLTDNSLVNFGDFPMGPTDENGFPVERPSRIGFAEEPGQLLTLSDEYHQIFLIWGEYGLVHFAFDPTGEDYIALNYNAPKDETGLRVWDGGPYYCKAQALDQLLWQVEEAGGVTSCETSNDLYDLHWGLALDCPTS
jgi:hypothetical protein